MLSDRVVVMSPRPGEIAEIIDVAVGVLRSEATRADDRFFAAVRSVRGALRGSGAPAAAESGREVNVE